MAAVVAFVLPERPLSFNAGRRDAYAGRLVGAFRAAGGLLGAVEPPCYGIVYHLHRGEDRTDADNVSKPVWDALKGVAYEDDSAVRLRVAGSIRIDRGLPPELDLTGVPPRTFRRLTILAGKQAYEHMTYVELGALSLGMFPFGLGA